MALNWQRIDPAMVPGHVLEGLQANASARIAECELIEDGESARTKIVSLYENRVDGIYAADFPGGE